MYYYVYYHIYYMYYYVLLYLLLYISYVCIIIMYIFLYHQQTFTMFTRKTQAIALVLVECRTIVWDVGPALRNQWENVSRSLALQKLLLSMRFVWHASSLYFVCGQSNE